MYDRHDRPSSHHLLQEALEVARTLGPDARAALWELAGGCALRGASAAAGLVDRLQTVGRTWLCRADLATVTVGDSAKVRTLPVGDAEQRARAEAMRRHPSYRAKEAT